MTENKAEKQLRHPNYPSAPPLFPPPNCPRCFSSNTKFCYYNNYRVSQPRYFCKECRRYWTHGGVLRNIPSGGTSRKRPRADSASSSSHSSKPPPPGLSMGSAQIPVSGGHGTFRPEMTQTVQSFNGAGLCYQQPFMLSANCELGGVNAAFDAVNVAFSTSQPAPSTMMLPQLSPLNGVGEFGFNRFVQRPLHHQPTPPPRPSQLPATWAGQNTGLTSTRTNMTGSNNFDMPTTAANVVSINEWSELKDMMDNE